MVAEEQLRVMMKAISEATRMRRRQKSGRRDRSEEGLEGGRTDSKE